MNLVETYVTNIRSITRIPDVDFCLYKIVCDTNCYGHKLYNTTIYANESDYEMIKTKGYYLT